MVTGERSYEEQTRRRLSEARTKVHELEIKKDEIQKQFAILLKQIVAYETILEGYTAETQLNWSTACSGANRPAFRRKSATLTEQIGHPGVR